MFMTFLRVAGAAPRTPLRDLVVDFVALFALVIGVSRLGVEPRTIRDMAVAGEIPGAAKFRGVWSFDIALLDSFVSDKERETCQNSLTVC
jgi:hypothetical protein